MNDEYRLVKYSLSSFLNYAHEHLNLHKHSQLCLLLSNDLFRGNIQMFTTYVYLCHYPNSFTIPSSTRTYSEVVHLDHGSVHQLCLILTLLCITGTGKTQRNLWLKVCWRGEGWVAKRITNATLVWHFVLTFREIPRGSWLMLCQP